MQHQILHNSQPFQQNPANKLKKGLYQTFRRFFRKPHYSLIPNIQPQNPQKRIRKKEPKRTLFAIPRISMQFHAK